MAIPDTDNDWGLDDVITEVVPTTDDLVDCFSDAIAAKFDATYEGSKNQLLNFRNYGAITLTSFSTSTTTQTSNRNACGQTTPTTRYHDGASFYPAINDTVWNTSAGTGVPSNGYYKNANNTWYQLTSGVVVSTEACR